jgi:hypothetical protein
MRVGDGHDPVADGQRAVVGGQRADEPRKWARDLLAAAIVQADALAVDMGDAQQPSCHAIRHRQCGGACRQRRGQPSDDSVS